MVHRALSDRNKKAEAQKKKDKAEQEAAEAYILDQRTAHPKGLQHFTDKYSVTKTTLSRRVNGQRSQTEYAASQQKLTIPQERVLVDFTKESADRGFPLNHASIVSYGTAILKSSKGLDAELGEGWIFAFLDRHRDELQTHWSKPLDTQRARALNPEAKKAWFELVKEFIVNLGIREEDTYAMDESGFPPSHQGKERVVGARGTKTQHKQGGASHETVTALVTICADGTVTPPMIIYKGKNMMKKWGGNNVANAAIACSENGWTDTSLGQSWIEKNFDKHTKAKADGRTRVLLLDGHSSHYSRELLWYARENNIVILGYPPHCTHALQGLDVVCFARMKEVWKQEINKFEQENKKNVGKNDFTGLFGAAFLRAFTPDLVKAAFRATGVHPYDPTVITDLQMKPSLPTSTKASFPLPQPSPVRKVMETFRANPPTTFDTDPTLLVPPRNPEPVASSSRHQLTPSPPTTPSRRPRDESSNLDFTPSKRMRLLSASVAQTRSSYLVGRVPISSAHRPHAPVLEAPPPLPEPDWSLLTKGGEGEEGYRNRAQMEEHIKRLTVSLQLAQQHIKAHDLIIEAAHAQLIVQDMHLNAQNQVLEAKEKKGTNKRDRTILFPQGFGRCLTSDEFTGAIEAQAARLEEERQKKEQRAELRAQKRSKKDLVDSRWKAALEEWNQAKSAHDDLSAGLVAGGTRKSDLPKAPKKPLKKDITAQVESELGDDESEDEEASDGEADGR